MSVQWSKTQVSWEGAVVHKLPADPTHHVCGICSPPLER